MVLQHYRRGFEMSEYRTEADVWKELIKARSKESELLSELWRFWESTQKKLECETKKQG